MRTCLSLSAVWLTTRRAGWPVSAAAPERVLQQPGPLLMGSQIGGHRLVAFGMRQLLAQALQARLVGLQFRGRGHYPRTRQQDRGIERLYRARRAHDLGLRQAEADLLLPRGQRDVDVSQDLGIQQAAVQRARSF